MKKRFTLPKHSAAHESAGDATENPTQQESGANQDLLAASFSKDTTNLRRDFVEQAKRIKEIVLLGKTPEREEHPKLDYSLDGKGFLKGDAKLVKDTGTTATIDLVKKAEAVNEGVKRPVFKRKSSLESAKASEPALEPSAPIKDERESEDKQPKEAVACEARFPTFNKQEQDLISSGNSSAIRAKMADGSISKVRGRQMLYTMGATESEEVEEPVFVTISTDAGSCIDKPEEEVSCCSTCYPHGEALLGIIDTEIGDDLGCEVCYTSKAPISGQIIVPDADIAQKISSVFEGIGVKAHTVAAKEEFAVLFEEQSDVPVSTWYALIRDAHNKSKVSQITITATDGAVEDQIKDYLTKTYSPEQIVSVSQEKY